MDERAIILVAALGIGGLAVWSCAESRAEDRYMRDHNCRQTGEQRLRNRITCTSTSNGSAVCMPTAVAEDRYECDGGEVRWR